RHFMKSSKLTKKIIAGKFKGKTLHLPPLSNTRSSKSVVLESFFNTLQFDIIDATFVEVFAGSGSIGLEALSRGASRVIFMEKDSDAFKTLQKNISTCNPSHCEAIRGNSFVNIDEVTNRLKKSNTKAYFYIDPPFSIRDGHEEIYNKTISLISSLNPDVVELITIEHMSGLELSETVGSFEKMKSKKFGNTTLTYYKCI
ncbi:MAG: 16S rRNA (guanine(966)-N(2))-methyltransferase RsmD, partial [Campylobacterota bacterium]|nr:16S rRNA (guanine(966)-N(2))-methyltransferase RsmD [Campylobacterota bacterium]